MDTNEIRALIARVKAATGRDREVDAVLNALAAEEHGETMRRVIELWTPEEREALLVPYTDELDAVWRLCRQLRPGCRIAITDDPACRTMAEIKTDWGTAASEVAETPALALIAALLAVLLVTEIARAAA